MLLGQGPNFAPRWVATDVGIKHSSHHAGTLPVSLVAYDLLPRQQVQHTAGASAAVMPLVLSAKRMHQRHRQVAGLLANRVDMN